MAHKGKADDFKLAYDFDTEQEDTDNKTYTVDSMDEGNKEDPSISAEREMISGINDSKHVGYSMLWEEGVTNNTVRSTSVSSHNSGASGSSGAGVVNAVIGGGNSGGGSRNNPFNSTGSASTFTQRNASGNSAGIPLVANVGRVSVKEEVHRYSNIAANSATQRHNHQPEAKKSQNSTGFDYTYNKVPSRGSSAAIIQSSNSPGLMARRNMQRQSLEETNGGGSSNLSNRSSDSNNYDMQQRRSSIPSGLSSPQAQQRIANQQIQHRTVSQELMKRDTESDIPSQHCTQGTERLPNDNRNAAQASEKTTEVSERDKKILDRLGTPVYQIEVRFIVYKGLRFCGGVRVLLNCPEESAYLQLITLQDEVFVTYDINNICFLEPRSAAGVSFCGVPFNPLKNQDRDDNPETDISATEPTDATERKRQRCREKKARMSVIDHAEVVFCTPEQTMRFKTVIDTLLCAVACEDPNVPPQSLTELGGAVPASVQERTEGVPFGDGGVNKRNQYNNQTTIIYPQSMKQHDPSGDQYGTMVKNKYGMIQSFDPCPRGPVSTSMCLPCDLGDPYQLNPDEGRVVFCTPACLKVCCRNGEKMVYKGKLKIVQGTGGIGFVIRIESTDGTTLYCHSLRRDLILYETNDVQYGFCYSTVVCTAGRTSMETFVVAFPSSYQCDQFKHAINTCKDILGMTSVQSLINVNRT